MPPDASHALPARIDAVIFDLDGTLIDSEPDLRAGLNKLLAEMDRRPVVRDEVVMMVGDGVPKLVERALGATGGVPDGGLDAAVARFLGFYEGAAADLTEPFPGAGEILRDLKAAGAKLGICTNKPEAPTREILASFGFDAHVAAVVGGATLGDVRKPDPRHLAAVLERLGVAADGAVMVGDNANDVATARGLGVPAVAVSFGYSRGPVAALEADHVIDRFDELWAVLAGLA